MILKWYDWAIILSGIILTFNKNETIRYTGGFILAFMLLLFIFTIMEKRHA